MDIGIGELQKFGPRLRFTHLKIENLTCEVCIRIRTLLIRFFPYVVVVYHVSIVEIKHGG